MWFLISMVSLILAAVGFVYVIGVMTSLERAPGILLKWYVEFLSTAVFALVGFSIFAFGKFIYDTIMRFLG